MEYDIEQLKEIWNTDTDDFKINLLEMEINMKEGFNKLRGEIKCQNLE